MESTYFVNHGNSTRWPYTLYYGDIDRFIDRAVCRLPPLASCLNVGCGLFESYPVLKRNLQWFACDVDLRCIEHLRRRYPGLQAEVCGEYPAYPSGTFDFVFASEVIEHVSSPVSWVGRLFELLSPGGQLIVTTPNYGVSLLPILEFSVLEIIARMRGFTRFGIHPNKYNIKKLRRHLDYAVGSHASIVVQRASHGMVLIGDIRRLSERTHAGSGPKRVEK